MSSHRPRRTEQLRDATGLLDAMGRCRKVVLDAQDSVKPFGVVFHGCGMVTAAIDALAYLVTGHPHHYSLGGSIPSQTGMQGGGNVSRDRAPAGPGPEAPAAREPEGG